MKDLLHILLGLLLLASLHTPPCSAADTLLAGQALAIGDKLVSRNGKFALGFFEPTAVLSKSKNITSPNWYLGIWFNQIPVFTTVWVANRESPITDPKLKLTQLKISSDGNLAIVNHGSHSESIVWSTNTTGTRGASTNTTTAVLLDSGNLALLESPSSNVTLWQSFDYPTDVLLPGAKFGRNKVTGFNRQGITRKSLIDPGLGSYSVEIDASGVVLKHRNPSVVYWTWASGPSTLKLIPILKAILERDPRTRGLIDPTYVDNSEEEYYMYTSLNASSLTFVSLDISGQIKMNVWSHAQRSWQAIFSQPADACTPYATCGPFTTCNGVSPPFCDCMQSFSQKSPQEWELDDRTGGLPYNPKSIDDANSQTKCEEACLSSCSCTAYSYNSSRCSVWHGELFSVNHNDGIDNNSEDVLYLRLAADDPDLVEEPPIVPDRE